MPKHGLPTTTAKQSQLANGSSYITSCRLTHQIQETNIDTTIIDVSEKSSSDCPLTERSLQERINKCLRKDIRTPAISSETKANLNKLQQITDDVKSLTKQLQLSVQLNRNNNASGNTLDERLLGEICYQLERRILLLIFSNSKQLYGYSLRYLSLIIDNEQNEHERSIYRRRLEQIEKILSVQKFHLNYHSVLTFYFINQYGIYADYQWLTTSSSLLSDLAELKAFCHSLVSKEYHEDLSIIVNSLDLISHCDGKPLFYW